MLILKKKINKLSKKIDLLLKKLEVCNVLEYIETNLSTKKLLWRNFIIGIAKGMGIAIGFTILGAIAIYFLRKIVMLNLPVIGAFIKDIVDIVEEMEQNKIH